MRFPFEVLETTNGKVWKDCDGTLAMRRGTLQWDSVTENEFIHLLGVQAGHYPALEFKCNVHLGALWSMKEGI